MMMMQLNYPSAVTLFYAGIFEFVTFDTVPSDEIYGEVFDFGDDDSPFSEQCDAVGYGSRQTIINSGSITIFFVLMITLQLVYLLVARLLRFSGAARCHGFIRKKQQGFIWASLVDFFAEAIGCMSFAFMINTSEIRANNPSQIINISYFGITGVALILGPFCIGFSLNR